MAEIYFGPDAIRWYLTGAGSDGGAQTNPLAALGNYRSSTMATFLNATGTAPTNITIDFVGGANGEGSGSLETGTGGDSQKIRWTAPGGTAGDYVAISSGQTKVLKDGGSSNKYVVVSASGVLTDSQSTPITLETAYNNLIGGKNVTSAEATAGEDFYLASMLKCHCPTDVLGVKLYLATLGTQAISDSAQLPSSGAGTITTTGSLSDWPTSGWARITDNGGSLREIVYYTTRTATSLTVPSAGRARFGTSAAAGVSTDTIDAVPGISIAEETPTADAIQTIGDIYTAPTGLTWNTGISSATGISLGDLSENDLYGLWIWSEYPAGTTPVASQLKHIRAVFDAAP